MEPAEQNIDGAVLVLNHPAPTDDGHNGRQDPGNDQQDAEQATQGEAFDEEEGQAQTQQITAHDAEDGKDGTKEDRVQKLGIGEGREIILEPDEGARG